MAGSVAARGTGRKCPHGLPATSCGFAKPGATVTLPPQRRTSLLVILFRHGPAGRSDPKRWPDDRDRPLTTDGEKRTRQAAEGLARLLRDEELARIAVWTSPLVRAG